MLDKLFESFGGDVMNSLTEKAGISMDQAKEVLPIAQETVQGGIMEQVTSGNVAGLSSMLSSNGSDLENNSIFSGIKQKFMGAVISKMGMPEAAAGMVANVGMADIMGKISGAVSGEDGSIDESNLMSQLGGGSMMDAVSGMAKGKLGDMTKGLF